MSKKSPNKGDRISVAHILTRLDMGGAQFNTLYTVANLNREQFNATLVAGPGGTMEGVPNDVEITFMSHLRREISPLHDIMAVFQIAAYLKRTRPDIVHTHSSKAGIIGRIAARIAGIPVIVHTAHGFGFNPYQNTVVRGFYVFLERLCARISSALIFVSKSNMDYASSCGIGRKDQYNLIRSGIRLSEYPAKADRKEILRSLGIPDNTDGKENVIVFSIGNSKPQKNPADFIMAAAEMCGTRPNLYFIFAGGGEELPKFQKMAEDLNVGGQCRLIGWRRDTARIMSVCDIYAMTSLWEGLPRSLVEAFASGKPAVCYRADGVADILKDGVNGYSTEKKDLPDFVEKLSRLVDDSELRRRLAKGAKETDLAEFDIDYMVRQQEELYKSLVVRS